MEALGGAASVIGVTSLAIQLCEKLQNLHDFWQSVRGAPDDIANISTEINLFMTLLAVIANNYQRQGFNHRSPNHITVIDTLKLCLAKVDEMNDGVKDLESRLSTGLLSKRWASVKFVFRRNRREKVMQQIERMKSLLIIVQACYNGEMQEAGFQSLSMSLRPNDSALQTTTDARFLELSAAAPTNETQGLEPIPESAFEMMSFDPTASPQAPRSLQRKTTKQEEGAYNFGLAMLRFVSTEQESVFVGDSGNERRIPARRTRCDLRIAQWLLSRGFSWQSSGTYGNWQYSFRTFRYVPHDALIVDFCREGDTANVQRMFDKGLASPFDRVRYEGENWSQDWSLLHFSIQNCHVHLCRFLIECGLGHGSVSGMSRIPILLVPGLVDFFVPELVDLDFLVPGLVGLEREISDPAAYLDTLRTMIHEGQYDPMEEANRTTLMHSYRGTPTGYRWLLDQEDFLIDFEQKATTRQCSIAAALVSGREGLQISSCLEAVIAHGSELNDVGKRESMDLHVSLAHKAVFDLPSVVEIDDFPKRIKILWDAGTDFGSSLDYLFLTCIEDRYKKFEVNRESIPAPPLMADEFIGYDQFEDKFIDYDRFEDTSAIQFRPRTPKSLWRTWYPGHDLRVMEVAQRHLDAWMEVLLEARIDIAEYGRQEDRLHPEGLLGNLYGEARVHFEYGGHVDGCRIHVTQILTYDLAWRDDNAEPSTMPGSWDFDDD